MKTELQFFLQVVFGNNGRWNVVWWDSENFENEIVHKNLNIEVALILLVQLNKAIVLKNNFKLLDSSTKYLFAYSCETNFLEGVLQS